MFSESTYDTSDLYPIGTVAELTGVNPITLRAWERRYRLLEPVRKASGHRLYTRDHIDLITRVVGLLDRGMRIGQVKRHLEGQQALGAEPLPQPWQRYLNRMIAGVIQFDEAALEATYGEALAVFPVQAVTTSLLTPLLQELGRRWEDGEGTVAEEHFFGCYLRNKLGARFHHRRQSVDGPTLVLACLPGERHETGLLLFALAASDAGYRTILLGADMPISELPVAARKTGAAAVVLSGFLQVDEQLLEAELAPVVRALGRPIFIGGRASIDAFDAFKRAGAEPLGIELDTGLARIDAALGRARQAPAS